MFTQKFKQNYSTTHTVYNIVETYTFRLNVCDCLCKFCEIDKYIRQSYLK